MEHKIRDLEDKILIFLVKSFDIEMSGFFIYVDMNLNKCIGVLLLL